ncbi:MAG: DUF4097 family beta strand repeat protein [Bacilli bacterium]|nr:DUF4097 family beta strand repeat protein [Bacilli bacterium]
MKSKGFIITLIVILSIFALTLTGGFLFLLIKGDSFDFYFDINDSSMELVDSIKEESLEIKKVSFNLFSTDVEIKKSDDSNIVVEYYSNRENNPKIEFSDGVISIDEEKNDVSCFGFCNNRTKVVFYVPRDYSGNAEVTTKSGDFNSNIDLLDSVITISTMSGDVDVQGLGTASISTMSGDVNIQNITKMITLSTMSGDVEIINFNITDHSSIKTVSGDIDIDHNKSACYVETKTTSGDINVKKSNRKSDLVLTIKTTSGDISVN